MLISSPPEGCHIVALTAPDEINDKRSARQLVPRRDDHWAMISEAMNAFTLTRNDDFSSGTRSAQAAADGGWTIAEGAGAEDPVAVLENGAAKYRGDVAVAAHLGRGELAWCR
jgi:hypothetical protein